MSRTKNGKSLRINWFPISESFVEAVQVWIELVTKAGLKDDDALFPRLTTLKTKKDIEDPNREPIEPMTTKDAVTKAFALACRDAEVKYNPHSVKDTIAAERDRRPLTQLQRKAWSENMGHDSEKITETHYGKLSEEERSALFEEIVHSENSSENTSVFMSDEDKIALVNGVLASVVGAKRRSLQVTSDKGGCHPSKPELTS